MDENGLELSLGLSFGGSSGKPKGKGSRSDLRAEGDDQGNKTVGDFKGFLDASKNKPVPQVDPTKPQENFFSNLSKAHARTDEEEVRIEGTTNKRMMMFDEISCQKKHSGETKHSDAQDKSRTSHIFVNNKEGSVADNEDVAESEAGGCTSKLVSYNNTKDVHENKVGNLTYGIPYSVQPMNVANGLSQGLPLRDSSSVSALGTPIYAPPVARQPLSFAENERQGVIKAMASGNMPVILGYPPVPLLMMDKENSWLFAPHTAYPSQGPPTLAPSTANPNSSSEVSLYGQSGRMEITKGDGKQHAPEEVSSTLVEDDTKAVTDYLFAKFPAIKPGMAADVKFGGSASVPNLPWVSTTGPGPNGRTISGVTYRCSVNLIRIVCACHGSHLSPEEFVGHASDENPNAENGPALPAIHNIKSASSAQR